MLSGEATNTKKVDVSLHSDINPDSESTSLVVLSP
jgi:hypothetical protein